MLNLCIMYIQFVSVIKLKEKAILLYKFINLFINYQNETKFPPR